MVDALELTEDQELKFVEIIEAQHQQAQTIKAETRVQLGNVLSEEQLATFDEMAAKKESNKTQGCGRDGQRKRRRSF